jgi:SPP1 family predicted phage head-tail adaptor
MVMRYPHLIDIERFVSVDDGMGGHTEEWTPYLTDVEAHVQPITGNEYYQAQQIQNPVQVDIYTPFNGAIRADMRVIYNGETLSIKSVLDQGGMNKVLLLKCSYFQ